jgi:hypothetical protein
MRNFNKPLICDIDIETLPGERTLRTEGTLVSMVFPRFAIKCRVAHHYLADLDERIERYTKLGTGHRGTVLRLTQERNDLLTKLVAQAAAQVPRKLRGNRHFVDCVLTILFGFSTVLYTIPSWWPYVLAADLVLVFCLWYTEHFFSARVRCIEHLIGDVFAKNTP